MVTNRWNQAQEYELRWWESRKESINLNFYKAFAEDLLKQTKGIFQIDSSTKILEIGSGAAGIITYLQSRHRYAIDPLEDFYSSVEQFAKGRDSEVQYKKASGEELPYENSFFDFIIMDNVLDHCSDTEKVVQEMVRVLRSGGYVYFRQNVYHPWGKFIRSIMELFLVDKGHPHTFTHRSLNNLLKNNSLSVITHQRSGYFKRWKYELFAKTKNDLIKALLFVNRDRTLMILKKR